MQKEITKKHIANILQKYQQGRENIIKCLHELQDNHPQNYLSIEILDETAKYFNLTRGQLFGIASYYSMFSMKPRGKHLIRICKSPVCNMLGKQSITEYIYEKTGLNPGETSNDGNITVEYAECLGRCGKAPAIMVNRDFFTNLNDNKINEILCKLK